MTAVEKQFTVFEILSKLKEKNLDPTDTKILDKIVSKYKDIVGEESNIKVVFLAALSRKLSKSLRIHIANHSRSGAGKSWVLRKVLKPFWNDVIEITRFTDSWLSRSGNELENMILLWQQVNRVDEHGKGTTGQIKILLTDEGISYAFMQNNNGQWVPRHHRTNALPIVITTTTNQINDEDARRFFLLSADESEEQTNKIIAHNLQKAASIKFGNEIQDGYEMIKHLVLLYDRLAVGLTDIKIPFANHINDLLPKNFQMRTDINKLIQIINLVAFVHILERKVVIKNRDSESEERYLIAEMGDLHEAVRIACKIFTQTNYRMPDGSVRLLTTIRRLCENQPIQTDVDLPTIKDCVQELNVPRPTLYSYLNPLKDYGFVESLKLEGTKEVHLKLTGKAVNEFEIKQFEYSIDDLMKWLKLEFGEDAKLISMSDCMIDT